MSQEKPVRRRHSPEFKQEAVRLVTEQGQAVSETARHLGLNENMRHRWKKEQQCQRAGTGLGAEEREELRRLREENRRLRLEREILKKAAAFFAKEAS